MATLEGHTGNVTAVAWQNEGKWIVTSSEDGCLKIWDPRSPKAAQRNFDHKAAVNDVVIHPNQGELISCDQSGAIKIWDLGGRACTHELVRIAFFAQMPVLNDRTDARGRCAHAKCDSRTGSELPHCRQ